MADNAGNLEGEPFGTVDFRVRRSNGILELITIDCLGLKTPLIGGHKIDVAEMLNVGDRVQEWKYNDMILEDEKRLLDYGITGIKPVVITVTVS